jgi:imidazolonepropionase
LGRPEGRKMNRNLVIRHASQMVTCSGTQAKRGKEMAALSPIEDGCVIIEGGKITAAGRTGEIEKRLRGFKGEVIDADGKAVLPGFVDSHTHTIFSGDRAEEFSWRLAGSSFLEILERGGGIISTVRATRAAPAEALYEEAFLRLDSMLAHGVTTVEIKSGYGLDLDTEIKQLEVAQRLDATHPVDVVSTFLGAHATPPEYAGNQDGYIDFVEDIVLPAVCEKELADFCDVFCDTGVFSVEQARKLLQRAKELGLKLKLHADEIACLGGAELAAELGAVSADHLLHASDSGIKAMAEAGVIAGLLPGTAFCLGERFARARHMIESGLAVTLATDLNPGTFYSESIPFVFALAVFGMHMSVEETVTALTINAAAALGRADRIGSIDPGKNADLIILTLPSYTHIPYRTGVNIVDKVVKSGAVVWDRSLER